MGGFKLEYNHKFKKKFGQNFLQDKSIIDKIANSIDVSENDIIIEIGPGAGYLTKELITKTRVLAYEIDKDLEETLNRIKNNNLEIVWDDFLKRDIKTDLSKYTYDNAYVIANLPYYITTPIITKIINSGVQFNGIVVMVQKEVADRFSSLPGCREYGSITVFLNYYFKITKLFNVSRNSFYPKPNVDSAVIYLKRKKTDGLKVSEEKLFKLVNDCFRYKRKTIKNNLQGYDLKKISTILVENGYSLSSRAEQIPLEIFIKVANII